jgi:hypothetical protein
LVETGLDCDVSVCCSKRGHELKEKREGRQWVSRERVAVREQRMCNGSAGVREGHTKTTKSVARAQWKSVEEWVMGEKKGWDETSRGSLWAAEPASLDDCWGNKCSKRTWGDGKAMMLCMMSDA